MKRLLILIGALSLALVVGVPTVSADDNPNGFLRNRAPLNQTMNSLVAGKFYVEFRCAELCLMKTRLVMSPHEATAAGFDGVKAGQWFEIGRVENVALKPNLWTKVQIPLNAVARRVLAKSEDGVRFAGQSVAASKISRRSGWANWIRTCKWPRT